MDDEKCLRELEELNIELMDTLLTAVMGFLRYCREHQIQFKELDGLAGLVGRAGRICEEIGEPYHKNPIVERFKRDKSKEGDLATGLFLIALVLPHGLVVAMVVRVSPPNELPHFKSPNGNDALPRNWPTRCRLSSSSTSSCIVRIVLCWLRTLLFSSLPP